ncbi:hypothetical protein INR49_006910, partial [Caranx melampygus]
MLLEREDSFMSEFEDACSAWVDSVGSSPSDGTDSDSVGSPFCQVFSPGTDASDSDFFSDFSDCSSDSLSPSLGYSGSFFPEPEPVPSPAAAGLSSTADAILNMITEIVGICTDMEQQGDAGSPRESAPSPAAPSRPQPPLLPSSSLRLPALTGGEERVWDLQLQQRLRTVFRRRNEALFPCSADSLLPLSALEQQVDVADFIESLLSSEAAQGELKPVCEVKQEPMGLEEWLKSLTAAPVTGGDSSSYVISRPVVKTELVQSGSDLHFPPPPLPSTLDAHLLSSLLQGAFPIVNINNGHAPGTPK